MTHQVGQNYRVKSRAARALARAAVVLSALALMVGVGGGCAGFAEEARPSATPEQEVRATAEKLFAAMEVVFGRETAGVDIALEERLTLISHYEAVDEQRRRRFVGQVVPVGRGGMGVQIVAEYQRQVEGDEESDGGAWRDAPRQAVEEEAAPTELRLARMVERVYHDDR